MLPTDSDIRKNESVKETEEKEELRQKKDEKTNQKHNGEDNSTKSDDQKDIKVKEKEIKETETTSANAQSPINTESPFLKTTVAQDKSDDNEQEPIKAEFSSLASLYQFDAEKKEFKQRGVGKIYIEMGDSLSRIFLIREKINRLACNHYISPLSNLVPYGKNDNTFLWNCLEDTVEDKVTKNVTFAVRFKEKETAALFKEKYAEAQKRNEEKIKEKK